MYRVALASLILGINLLSVSTWLWGRHLQPSYLSVTLISVGYVIAIGLVVSLVRRIPTISQQTRRYLYPVFGLMMLLPMAYWWTAAYQTASETQSMVKARSNQQVDPTHHLPFKRTTIPPRVTFEQCLEISPQESVSYSFQASHPITFDLHYHSYGLLYYALREHTVATESRTYRPSSKQDYCLTWRNDSAEPIELEWRYEKNNPSGSGVDQRRD